MQKLFHSIWEDKNKKVVLPATPMIPLGEGSHFLILHKKIKSPFWKTNQLGPIIECSSLALGIARMIIEDPITLDFWANIQWCARYPFNKGVNVFGRSPFVATWGEPLVFPEKFSREQYSSTYLRKLRRVCGNVLDMRAEISPHSSPFLHRVEDFIPSSQEFTAAEKIFTLNRPLKKQKDVLWVNEKFIVVSPRSPHLTGFHFQIFPRLKYWNKLGGFRSPWQLPKDVNSFQSRSQVQGYIEMTAILFGIIKILSKEKDLNFHNPEIHFSGNWNKDLLPKEGGGELFVGRLNKIKSSSPETREKIIKKEKERYLVGGESEFSTIGHGHLYATSSGKRFVKLPPRPFGEMPKAWEGIKPLKKEKVNFIRDLLEEALSTWLHKAAQE